MAVVNALLKDKLILMDASGAPITGADLGDFTATASLDFTSPLVSASVTITEASGGEYVVQFTPTRLGRWTVDVAYDDGTVDGRRFMGSYDVTPAPFVGLSTGRPIRR